MMDSLCVWFLTASTTLYLFSCWQVNQSVKRYYRLKADWDRQVNEGYYLPLGIEDGDVRP